MPVMSFAESTSTGTLDWPLIALTVDRRSLNGETEWRWYSRSSASSEFSTFAQYGHPVRLYSSNMCTEAYELKGEEAWTESMVTGLLRGNVRDSEWTAISQNFNSSGMQALDTYLRLFHVSV